MRKFTLLIASLFITIGAMAQTATIEVSTSVETPEHMYTMKSGNNHYMSSYTSLTTLVKGRFAFYAVEGVENAYQIYSVDNKKWVSYTKADSYSNKTNFAELVDDKDAAQHWNAVVVTVNNVDYYQFAPYNNTGVAAKYMNLYKGIGSNPDSNTTVTVGLWQGNASADAGSRWLLEGSSITEFATQDAIDEFKSLVKTTVGYPATTTNAYLAQSLLIAGATSAADLNAVKNAYLTSTNIILPENGKAYTIANKAYDGILRYLTYTEGQKPTVPTTSNAGSVFICKKIGDKFVFITVDGNILTWIGNNDNNAYNENGVYGYSTSYQLTPYATKAWNDIAISKQRVGNDKNLEQLGTVCMYGQRNTGARSSFLVKTTANRFDQSNETQYFGTEYSSAWVFTEVEEHENNDAQALSLAKIDFKFSDVNVAAGLNNYGWTVDGEKVYDYSLVDAAATTDELNTVIANAELNMPEIGKYYRVRCSSGNMYLSSNTNNGYILMAAATTTKDDAASLFYYDGAFMTFATGRYISAASGAENVRPLAVGSRNDYALHDGRINNKAGTYLIQVNGRYLYGAKNRADSGGSQPTGGGNLGYNWWLEDITYLPVTITVDAKYATFHAPVAVSVPDGVTAHTVTINGEWATLSEALDVIPANTAVILYAENITEDTVFNFTITTSEPFEGDNALSGTVAAKYAGEEKDVYVLAIADATNDGEENPEVGLFKAEDPASFVLNSHKAYLELPKEIANNSNGFRFDFGDGTTTEIDEVKTENGNVKTVYDLQGRIVENPAAGIYIVNGKKVLVK